MANDSLIWKFSTAEDTCTVDRVKDDLGKLQEGDGDDDYVVFRIYEMHSLRGWYMTYVFFPPILPSDVIR